MTLDSQVLFNKTTHSKYSAVFISQSKCH